LFNLEQDPAERHNLADSHTEVRELLREELASLRDRITPVTPGTGDTKTLDAEQIRRLKDLGYLQ
jgi:predicted subunit of tRNA(5-methylaminomethyl-2-thiouridylate) methyltransferase